MKKSLLVISSPSGGGKSTVARYIMKTFDKFKFSISATTREPRKLEVDGKDYHFLTKEQFLEKIKNNEFVEWEEIFGNYYGTLKIEIEKAKNEGKCLIFDIDVKGAMSIKKHFPKESLLIFLSPPNKESLIQRLKKRDTETQEQLNERISRAEYEISFRDKFDYDIINDNLQDTLNQVKNIVIKYF